ncbi:MAG TPA: ankyrin repeat domain-containing protein [Candidatus Limnocylindrales bacterium]|nr:ankyrin repeat domain-containing protein [Candidatus Limnocylindrales bacterium]
MTASKSLPPRPSLDSLHKQAKKLTRDIAAGDAAAIARARAHLPNVLLPLTQRNAQLVIAREYGYAGWQDMTAEVRKRLDHGMEWAAEQAERIIHGNDVEGLKQLLSDCPALLSWRGHRDAAREGLLGFATRAYGDCFEPFREERFTRAACAELLIDSGAVVISTVFDGILKSRARGLLQLFRRKGLLPQTIKFLTAVGDVDAVRVALDESGSDLNSVTEAFTISCNFEYEGMASLVLDRAIALDPELRHRIEGGLGRLAFTSYFIKNRPKHATEVGLWRAFVMDQVSRAVYSWRGGETSFKERRGSSDLPGFLSLLHREPWLLGEAFVKFQTEVIERAALVGCAEFISALFDLNPAMLRHQPPPKSQAVEFAFTYANTHVIPVLTRIWPLPDDLPHAAGMGYLARVKQWFHPSGTPALGEVENHYPCSPYMPDDRIEEYSRQWGPPSQQRVLDVALAWAVINSHLDVADFLLQRGANINTTWSSHEPASILHELVWHRNYQAMQFLIDHGIDMTIKDHRWNSTAKGWAGYAAEDGKLARWLEEAERQRRPRA